MSLVSLVSIGLYIDITTCSILHISNTHTHTHLSEKMSSFLRLFATAFLVMMLLFSTGTF